MLKRHCPDRVKKSFQSVREKSERSTLWITFSRVSKVTRANRLLNFGRITPGDYNVQFMTIHYTQHLLPYILTSKLNFENFSKLLELILTPTGHIGTGFPALLLQKRDNPPQYDPLALKTQKTNLLSVRAWIKFSKHHAFENLFVFQAL